MAVARKQTLVQLSDRLIAALDERAAKVGRSRSELVRQAIEQYLAEGEEAEIDRQIVEGYRRFPPEDIWGEETVKRIIEADPW